MRRWLRLYALIIACFVPGLVHRGAAQITCTTSDLTPTVISGNELTRAGAIRLTDIFRMMPNWQTTSTDGYSWQATPGIAAFPEWNAWELMLDGQPLSITLLGEAYLNAYPLDVGLIDSVEVFEGPTTCQGFYARSGLIHIHSRQEKEHYAAGGSVALQNETGDPGPYRYTDQTSVNVDRSGPVVSVFGAISQRRWHLRASTMFDEHHVTDPRLRPRVRKTFTTLIPPRNEMDGWRFDVRTALTNSAVSLTYESSHLEHFRYLPSAGREIPLAYGLERMGGSGTFRISPRGELYFSGERARVELDHYRTMEELDVDWDEERVQGTGGIRLEVPTGFLDTGFSISNLRGSDADPIKIGAWFASFDSRPHPDLRLNIWLRTEIEDQLQTLKGGAGSSWEFVPGHSLDFSASVTELPVRHTHNLAYWLDRGLTTPNIPLLDPQISPDDGPGQRVTASGGWHWRNRYFSSSATASFSKFTSAQHVEHDIHLAVEDSFPWLYLRYFEASAQLVPWLSGHVTRLALEATVQPVHGLTARLYYGYTYPRSNQRHFYRAWLPMPEHRGHVSLTYAPVDRISVYLRLRHESWSEWPDYVRVAQSTNNIYPNRLPALALMDLAVRKRFWYDHLYISMLLTNVLSRHVQLHPAGAADDLMVMGRLHVQF